MRAFILPAAALAMVAGLSGEVAAQFGPVIDARGSFALLACDLEARDGPRVIFLQTASGADLIGRDRAIIGRDRTTIGRDLTIGRDIEDEACASVLAALLDAGLDIREAHDLSLRPGEGGPRRKAILWELIGRRR